MAVWPIMAKILGRVLNISGKQKQVPVTTMNTNYRQISNISCTYVGNVIVDHSAEVGASPVGTTPTT